MGPPDVVRPLKSDEVVPFHMEEKVQNMDLLGKPEAEADIFCWKVSIQSSLSKIDHFSCSCLAEASNVLSTRIREIDSANPGLFERYRIDLEPTVLDIQSAQSLPGKQQSLVSEASPGTIFLKGTSYILSRKMVLSTQFGARLSRYATVLLGFIISSFLTLQLSNVSLRNRLRNKEDIILPVIGLWVSVLFSIIYWFLALHRVNIEMALHALHSCEVVILLLSVSRAMAALVVNDIRLSYSINIVPALAALTIQALSFSGILCTFDALRMSRTGRKAIVLSTFAISLYMWLSHLLNDPEDRGWEPHGARVALWTIVVQPRDQFIAGFGNILLITGGAVWSLLVRGRDFAFLYDFLSLAPLKNNRFMMDLTVENTTIEPCEPSGQSSEPAAAAVGLAT